MLTKSGRAAARTTTPKNNLQNASYPVCAKRSSGNLQIDIGELLFCLVFPLDRELNQLGWRLFDRLLRRYVDLKHTGESI